MLSTTDAIVLALIPHSDKAWMLHAYTRNYGRVNYMVYGIGKKNAAGLYAPLALIQINAEHRNTAETTTLRSAQNMYVQNFTAADPYKKTIALFISEILFNTLRHPMPDEPMFNYITQAIQYLDICDTPQNFHIQFLIGFAAKLGFAIDEAEKPMLVNTPQSRLERQKQLRLLCNYLGENIDNWKEPKSLDILTEVFD